MPAFGEADLSNCEREQVHLAGSIQPHGALLVVRETDRVVVQASATAAAFLGLDRGVLGRTLDEIEGNLSERILPYLRNRADTAPRAARCCIGHLGSAFDLLLHRTPDGSLIIEFERPGPPVDLSGEVGDALRMIPTLYSLPSLCDEVARSFRSLTGYDRVMVYRFDEDGHGEVFSEDRQPDLESFLGNRYPASDIPQIARRLYVRNRIRVLVDVNYSPDPLTPRLSPLTGEDLDMSLCFLRSISPIHIQYLKNMGVSATLVVSLVVGGRLWGLVACHHYGPRLVHLEMRAVCELLGEVIATRIAALESFVQAQAELSVRRLEQRMIEAVSRDGDWRVALFDGSQTVTNAIGATGCALLYDGENLTTGDVPGTQQLRQIGRWLDSKPRTPVVSTAALGLDEPTFEPLKAVASGVLATPVSNSPGEYLLWFRPERIRTITWGGDPNKPVLIGDDPSQLSPRRSFAQWHQLVEGTSDPWTAADLTAARLISEAVADVALQFRAVRMLIARDQLDHVRRRVGRSELPVIVADPEGRILLASDAFNRMLGTSGSDLQSLDQLAPFLAEPAGVRRRLRDLLKNRRTWRAEIHLQTGEGSGCPLLVRADPVLSSDENVLGFVVLFTDLTQRTAADTARRRFQDGLRLGSSIPMGALDPSADRVRHNLLSTIVENAQLAALEVTDSVDVAIIPQMLESLQASVRHAANALQRLASDPESESSMPSRLAGKHRGRKTRN